MKKQMKLFVIGFLICAIFMITHAGKISAGTDQVDALNAAPELKITQQPVDIMGMENSRVTLGLSATGTGLTYTWYYNLPVWEDYEIFSTTNNASFSLLLSPNLKNAIMYCVVSDTYGQSVKSDLILIEVISESEYYEPGFYTQPQSQTVYEGETVNLQAAADGLGLKYEWYYATAGGNGYNIWNGRTTSSFSYKPTLSKNGMEVFCYVTDFRGNSAMSDIVTINVLQKLAITQQPESATVNAGASTTFSIKATGSGLSYQWYYKMAGGKEFAAWSGRTSASFSYTPSASKNGMQLYCIVKDSNGKTVQSKTVTLTVKSGTTLAITQQPESQEILFGNGDSATFTVKATGSGLSYQWYYKTYSATTFKLWSGRTSASLTYTPDSMYKNGMQLYCIVKDSNGNGVQSDIVTLYLFGLG